MIELDVNGDPVKDVREAQKDIERKLREMTGGPVVQAMRNATLAVTRDAKILAPVDTGRLRASITPSVSSYPELVQGVVGSNVRYAPYQELGWTTPSGSQVPGKRYLQGALEKNMERIRGWLERAIKKITES